MENIGDRILKLRNEKQLTQEQLAEKLGIAPSYLSNIERNNKRPSLPLLEKLVLELNTSFDYLLINDFAVNKQFEIKYNELFRKVNCLDKLAQEEFFKISYDLIESFKKINN